MADKKAKTRYSPKGRFVYPKFTVPDTKFKPEGEFSVKLVVDGELAAPLVVELDEAAQKQFEQAKEGLEKKVKEAKGKALVTARKELEELKIYVPYEPDYDDDGEENGGVVFKMAVLAKGGDKKTGKVWDNRVAIYDARGKELTTAKAKALKIGGGTLGRIAFQLVPFYTAKAGAGISLRLKGAQIIELVEYGGGLDFGAEEGGFSAEDIDDGFGDETGSDRSADDSSSDDDDEEF